MSPETNNSAKDAKGKVKEKLGWAAGDREVEAKGRVEREEAAAEEGRMGGDAVESVEAAEDEVRRSNEEID
ncbi:MAG: CsbD family protein [Actinomycetota bacterium]|nr:CsbD family protein [Actinomycetota bacterium]